MMKDGGNDEVKNKIYDKRIEAKIRKGGVIKNNMKPVGRKEQRKVRKRRSLQP